MYLMRSALCFVLLVIVAACTAYSNGEPMKTNDDAIQNLSNLAERDNFAEEEGTLYTGVHDPVLRANLNNRFKSAIEAFTKAVKNKATKDQYIELLRTSLKSFDRSTLDTEDAEHVAGNFEKIMDCIGLESSQGILNAWMYGFNPK
jgi:hypothetical protein